MLVTLAGTLMDGWTARRSTRVTRPMGVAGVTMLTMVTGTVGSLMVGILATAEPTVTPAAACAL